MIRSLFPNLEHTRGLRGAVRALLLRRHFRRNHDRYSLLSRFWEREPGVLPYADIHECVAAREEHLLRQGYGQPRKTNVTPFKRKELAK